VKAYVVATTDGKVIGTARVAEHKAEGGGPHSGRPVASQGQKVHEVDLPDEIYKIEDVEKFHAAVEKHLGGH
jgi:hypothetical protein